MAIISRAHAQPEVEPRDASTVALLRDGIAGIETWLLTRRTTMSFAAATSVFPGGRLADGDDALPFTREPIDRMAARFGCDLRFARALAGAAVRETFEETGVLLTRPGGDLGSLRARVENGEMAFVDLLHEHGLAVDVSLLHPWSRWVTPAGEPLRYDTRFFVAELPSSAVVSEITREASTASWVPARVALEQAARGERQLFPPTFFTLRSIAGHDAVADVIAASRKRSLSVIAPVLVTDQEGCVTLELPTDREL